MDDFFFNRCTLQYTSTLLAQVGGMSMMSGIYPTYEGLFISSWLSALVTMGDCEEVRALTPQIMSLPGIAGLFPHQAPACPFAAAKSMVQNVSKKFSEVKVIYIFLLMES